MEQLKFDLHVMPDITPDTQLEQCNKMLKDLMDVLRMEYPSENVVKFYNQIAYQILLCIGAHWGPKTPIRFKKYENNQWGSWDINEDQKLVNAYRNSFMLNNQFANDFRDETAILTRPEGIRRLLVTVNELVVRHCIVDYLPNIMEDFLEYTITLRTDGIIRTPAALARILVQTVDFNKKNNGKSKTIIDPSCGSGGFLTAVGRYLNKEEGNGYKVIGFEQDTLLVLACKLKAEFSANPAEVKQSSDFSYLLGQEYDIILANPPFGRRYLKEWGLNQFNEYTDPYQLFIRCIMDSLKPEGYCCLIVPDSFLYSTHSEAVKNRKHMLNSFLLEGVIKLPTGVFLPHTAVQASVLIFSKPNTRLNHLPATEIVFFYDLSFGNQGKLKLNEDEFITDWNKRQEYLNDWSHSLVNGPVIENIKGMQIPLNRKKPNIVFADFKQIEQLNYSLSPSHYQLDEIVELAAEEPSEILKKLINMEHSFMECLENILRESGSDV